MIMFKKGDMIQLDKEIEQLKSSTQYMWLLVHSQMEKAVKALLTMDGDLAREVISNEKRVNLMELKIDSDCEDLFALFSPVAMDLRFVLATLKINMNLERIGDIANVMAKLTLDEIEPFDEGLLEVTEFSRMFDMVNEMMRVTMKAYKKEDTKLATTVFQKDDVVDQINLLSTARIAAYLKEHPDKVEQGLNLCSIIRKLERVGDQSKNIAEEIIFYHEAKVLKHLQDNPMEGNEGL